MRGSSFYLPCFYPLHIQNMASLPDVPNQIHVLDPWIHTISRLIYRFRGGKLQTNEVLVYRVKMYASSLVFLRYLNNLMIFAIFFDLAQYIKL